MLNYKAIDDFVPDNVKWPAEMAEMLELFVDLYKQAGMDDGAAMRLAQATILALSRWRGGAMVYVPKADALKMAIKRHEIWQYYTSQRDVDMNDLAKRFDICVQTAYRIIKERRQIEYKKRQPSLLDDSKAAK